jgi:tRNA (guanine6-N2)-methyltransferase
LKLLLTTNPGIEDVVVDEAKAKMSARVVEARYGRGRVIVEVDEDKLYLVEHLRSIHRARILLDWGSICSERECLTTIRDAILGSSITRYITPETSFAVRVERAGDHEYNSMDIGRVAGDAVIEATRKAYGMRAPVDLDYPAVIVAVDVIFDEYFVGIELGGDLSWHRRGYRVYEHPAALKPTLAYAMIVLSGMKDGDTLLDPMCGGGTIPIEAAYLFESSKHACMDFNPRHIEGAKMNALAAMVSSRISFIVGDARKLTSYFKPRSVDIVVSNPPYGIRLGSPREVHALYDRFLEELAKLEPRATVLITTEHEYVKIKAAEYGLDIVHERAVAHGGLWPKILVLRT